MSNFRVQNYFRGGYSGQQLWETQDVSTPWISQQQIDIITHLQVATRNF
jgi:hypothetical protein